MKALSREFNNKRTVCRVAAEVRAFSQQSTTATGLLPANPLGFSLSIIFILTPSAPRSCETPPTASLFLCVLSSRRGESFSVEHELPGCGCLRGIHIRSEFRKICDLELSIYSVHIVGIAASRKSAAQNRLFRLRPHQVHSP